MCLPPAALATIAGGQMLGTIFGGYQQQQMGDYEKQLADRNAQQVEFTADTNESIQRNKDAAAISSQAVALAGQGANIGSGTPLLLLGESARNAELNALAIRQQGIAQGLSYKAQGAAAQAEGNNAFAASFGTAAGQLLNFAATPAGQSALASLGAI